MSLKRWFLTDKSGFSIMEGVVSIAVFTIAALGTYTSLILTQRYVLHSRQMAQAVNYTRSKLEEISDIEITEIADTYPPNENNYLYDGYEPYLPSARWKVQYFNEYGNPSTMANPLTIRITLYWKKTDNSDHSIQLATKVTPGAI
ncbi:hypothetical protein GF312_02650 [Candidatus Poribacteria bacterium]|nr:hypothetical protein [Candidatus Poribacteria bacterium]